MRPREQGGITRKQEQRLREVLAKVNVAHRIYQDALDLPFPNTAPEMDAWNQRVDHLREGYHLRLVELASCVEHALRGEAQ